MSNGTTNVQRLVAAGVLDDKYLGDAGRAKINAIKLTDEEIKILKYFKEELGENAPELGRSAVDLAEFQEDAVKKARRILARYDGVLIADSVGLGKTWIGKKLLEDFAYHRPRSSVQCRRSSDMARPT